MRLDLAPMHASMHPCMRVCLPDGCVWSRGRIALPGALRAVAYATSSAGPARHACVRAYIRTCVHTFVRVCVCPCAYVCAQELKVWVPAALQPDAFDVFVPQNGAELAAWTPPATPRHACIVTYDLVQVMKRAQTDRWAVRHCIHEQCMHTRYVYMQDMRGMRLTRPAALRGRPVAHCAQQRRIGAGPRGCRLVKVPALMQHDRPGGARVHACMHRRRRRRRELAPAGLQGCRAAWAWLQVQHRHLR